LHADAKAGSLLRSGGLLPSHSQGSDCLVHRWNCTALHSPRHRPNGILSGQLCNAYVGPFERSGDGVALDGFDLLLVVIQGSKLPLHAQKSAMANAPSPEPGLHRPTLPFRPPHRISQPMTQVFDMDDRARLSERFYGATRAVLARLP
jgi:hypothetical protein